MEYSKTQYQNWEFSHFNLVDNILLYPSYINYANSKRMRWLIHSWQHNSWVQRFGKPKIKKKVKTHQFAVQNEKFLIYSISNRNVFDIIEYEENFNVFMYLIKNINLKIRIVSYCLLSVRVLYGHIIWECE